MNIVLFISGPEIFIVLIVVLLLFGSKKIPELAKGLGKGMSEFRKATEDIKKELDDSTSEIKKDIDTFKEDINKSSETVKKNIEESTNLDDGEKENEHD